MKKIIFFIVIAALFILAMSCSGRTSNQKSEQSAQSAQDAPSTLDALPTLSAKERVMVQLFGRQLLTDDPDPYQNLNGWTDGLVGYRPFFTSCWGDDDGNSNAADRDKIFLCGGTTHEGGYSIAVLIDEEGNMKVDEETGDVVEYRIINRDTLLVFKNRQTGDVTNLLRKYDGNLHNLYVANFFNYLLPGKFSREGSSQTITFNAQKSSVTGLFSAGETSFTFFEEYGDSPVPILRFNSGEAYRAARSLEGLILIPMTMPEEDDDEVYMVQDESKPLIFLKRLDESAPGMPPGVYPLASVRLMTDAEIYLYTGDPANANLRIMRNEIFARYGYRFNTEIGSYFADQEWYSPQSSDVTGKLTEIERINIAMILKVEEKVKLASYVEISDPVERQYTNDILALPEMQFPRAAIMTAGIPSDTEPYYTIKAGSNMEDRFVTNYWFHVYVNPVYEIKVYDVVSDRELSLVEWRKEKEK